MRRDRHAVIHHYVDGGTRMWKRAWRLIERATGILTIIVLPFFLYTVIKTMLYGPTASAIAETCYTNDIEQPKAVTDGTATYAPLLNSAKDKLRMTGAFDPDFRQNEKTPARILEVSSEGDDLLIHIDWKETLFRLRAVDNAAPYTRFQGTWQNSDHAAGCVQLDLPSIVIWDRVLTIDRAPDLDTFTHGYVTKADDFTTVWPIMLIHEDTAPSS